MKPFLAKSLIVVLFLLIACFLVRCVAQDHDVISVCVPSKDSILISGNLIVDTTIGIGLIIDSEVHSVWLGRIDTSQMNIQNGELAYNPNKWTGRIMLPGFFHNFFIIVGILTCVWLSGRGSVSLYKAIKRKYP